MFLSVILLCNTLFNILNENRKDMERVNNDRKLETRDGLKNIMFTTLLISFVSIAAININIYVLAFLIILAPALLINVVWVLIHTNNKKTTRNRINS